MKIGTLLTLVVMYSGVFAGGEPPGKNFYVPENPKYTIVDSVVDSLRFTVEKTLTPCGKGHLASISSFVNPKAEIMGWHDFGHLEGPGWAANAVGGAYEIYRIGKYLGRETWPKTALAILDHVLDHGFIDEKTGFITGYRITPEGVAAMGKPKGTEVFCLNYKKNSDWFCPGSMAKVAYQLLIFADVLASDGDSARAGRMKRIAKQCGEWLRTHVPAVENGWFPRRITPAGAIYVKSPDGGNDKFLQTSADGVFILQLWAALTARGLGDYTKELAEKTAVYVKLGGIFGSINHDTYDAHENVAYAVGFRTLILVATVLGREDLREFAHMKCLAGLDQFKMREDRNGVATTGLLYMEKTWPTSYLWENAEAALAHFEAALELRATDGERSRRLELEGLTILRAAAKHHHGPYGFLTEGVDWSNHVSEKHHIAGAFYGDIQYTEPFLNNQHIAEPTLFYLEHLATITTVDEETGGTYRVWRDLEGNVVLKRPFSP